MKGDMTTKQNLNNILGIDIGGTGIKIAPVDVKNGKLNAEPFRAPTPQPAEPELVLTTLNELIDKFNWNGLIGCGFPGVVKKGVVYTAANLSDKWIGFNLKSKLEQKTAKISSVINDADAAALAEMKFGAGRDFNKQGAGVVMLFTLGTGIGSALFVDGHLVPNTEFGHMEMDRKDAEDWAATVVREKENLSWKVWGKRVNEFLNK
jgi:polyphosphate glucokinase